MMDELVENQPLDIDVEQIVFVTDQNSSSLIIDEATDNLEEAKQFLNEDQHEEIK